MHKPLGLQHHRHTGKRMSHHHTSYHALLFVLLLGGLVFGAINKASAITYDVFAKVSAPIPTEAANVLQPPSSVIINTSQLTITGVCQILNPAMIESVWSGSELLGSVVCSPDGTFSLTITLPVGSSTLIIKSENITHDFGPDSPPILVTYSLPLTPASGTPSTPAASDNSEVTGSSPSLTVEESFMSFVPGRESSLIVYIKDGQAPYVMTIDWGDGSHSTYNFDTAGKKILKHTFKDAGSKRVVIKITDVNGKTVTLVLGAQTTIPFVPASTTNTYANPTGNSRITYMVVGYVSTVSLVAGLWIVHSGHLGISKSLFKRLPGAKH